MTDPTPVPLTDAMRAAAVDEETGRGSLLTAGADEIDRLHAELDKWARAFRKLNEREGRAQAELMRLRASKQAS